jgi:hypothetical protein
VLIADRVRHVADEVGREESKEYASAPQRLSSSNVKRSSTSARPTAVCHAPETVTGSLRTR